MIKLLSLVLACCMVMSVCAQDASQDSTNMINQNNRRNQKRDRINRMLRMEEEGDLIFNKTNIFGIRLATNGYGISFEKGKFLSVNKTRLLEFELNEIRNAKEKRLETGDFFTSSSLIAYKLNNLYELKASYGYQQLIGGKGNKNGVAVTWLYTGGLSLGIVKPYYVNTNIANDPSGTNYQKTFTQIFADTTNSYVITGASGFTVGWGHVSFKPGLNAKTAMRFDYGRLNTSITAIEVGVTAEFYSGKIPILYDVPPQQFFFNGYVCIMFGSRK